MKSTDFINKHINLDIEIIDNKRFLNKVENFKKFASYLELLTKRDIYFIFQELMNNEVTCKTMMLDRIKRNGLNYSFNILQAEGLVEITEPNERLRTKLEKNFGSYNFDKMTYYCFTKKGKDLIKTNGIRKYLGDTKNDK